MTFDLRHCSKHFQNYLSSKSFCTMDRRDLRSVGFWGERKHLVLRFNMFYLKKCLIQKQNEPMSQKISKNLEISRNISKYLEKSRKISKYLEISRKISMLQMEVKGKLLLEQPRSLKKSQITLLRVIPTMTFNSSHLTIYLAYLSGIPSGMSSDVLSGISSDILPWHIF